jgi:Rieske Fe-S protein
VVFFDPLRRRGAAQPTGNPHAKQVKWIRVATLDAVPDDGVPRQFPVLADLIDAWNRTPNQPIGSVYLRRNPGEKTVECLTAICPHAGCFVAVVEGSEGKRFGCPCHTSAFSLKGKKLDLPGHTNPSPRDMDALKVDANKLANIGEIWVEYKSFYPGKEEQVEKT